MKSQKMFIIRKFIKAASAKDAIRKDSRSPVDEIWIDEDWKRAEIQKLAEPVGFQK